MTSRADPPLVAAPPPAPGRARKLRGWISDYAYVTYWWLRGLVSRGPSDRLLSPPGELGSPVLLIPGVYENWRFMQPVAEHFFRAGHPVHVLDKLGFNTGAIVKMAEIVRAYLDEHDLTDVTVIAHSKGGLIGKYALGDPDTLRRVRHLIAINTPFGGSTYAYLFLVPSVRMFTPTGPTIRQLALNTTVNANISSLYSVFDPHIPQTSHLDGAENILLPTIGHFRPIADAHTLAMITAIMQREAL